MAFQYLKIWQEYFLFINLFLLIYPTQIIVEKWQLRNSQNLIPHVLAGVPKGQVVSELEH
jgi:hypothetical protein